MHAEVRQFWLPKSGNSEAEYEDAFWSSPGAASEFPVRLAVADGATESYGSGLWAQLLVRAYGQGCFDGGLVADELRKHQTAWHDTVSQGDLPWYAEQKMQDGAFASLLGITIDQQEDGVAEGAWRALAVGDSCIFQVREGRLLAAFPLSHSSDFTSCPFLVSTDELRNAGLPDKIVQYHGTWRLDDVFFLATDALASWLLAMSEEGDEQYAALQLLDSQDAFDAWISGVREQGGASGPARLKNDDLTLISCVVIGG